MRVRPYTHTDYKSIAQWWSCSIDGIIPTPALYSTDSCYILELANEPVLAVSIYYSQVSIVATIELLIADPSLSKNIRAEAIEALNEFLSIAAKRNGCKVLIAHSPLVKGKDLKQGLGYRYAELGFKPSREVTRHIKEL